MTTKIVYLDRVGELMSYLVSKYERGEVEGMVVCIKNRDQSFEIGWSNLDYIERLGLLEAAKGDCHYKAMCAFCE